jgi:two-component system nitrate/nitrite response regulator NarL
MTRIAFISTNQLLKAGVLRILEDVGFEPGEPPDLAFVCTSLGTDDVLTNMARLLDRAPACRIVLYGHGTTWPASSVALAFSAGASAYVVDPSTESFIKLIDLVLEGMCVMPHWIDLGRHHAPPPPLPMPGEMEPSCRRLSLRERAILDLLSEGLANKEIANRLGISDSTVKVHVKAVLRKLQLRNRTQAATYLMRANGHSAQIASDISVPERG